MGNIPLNQDAKDYIKQQDLGYSFIEPTERVDSSYQTPNWDRGAGSLAMATGLAFNLDTVDTRTIGQIDHDLDKFTMGMASMAALPISAGVSLYSLGAKGTLGLLGAAAGFDIAGQTVQGGEYRPGQTLLAAQTALTLGPLAGSSWTFNAALGATAGGSNVAVNNFYYDDTKSVRQGVLLGGITGSLGTSLGNLTTGAAQHMPSQVSVPYFQTPAIITVPVPAATTIGKNIETVIHNIPAFIQNPGVGDDKQQGGGQ